MAIFLLVRELCKKRVLLHWTHYLREAAVQLVLIKSNCQDFFRLLSEEKKIPEYKASTYMSPKLIKQHWKNAHRRSQKHTDFCKGRLIDAHRDRDILGLHVLS